MPDAAALPGGIDWDATRARLEGARLALDAAIDRGGVETDQRLRERTRALARPVEPTPAAADSLDLLVFTLSDERYATEAGLVVEAVSLRGLVRVPVAAPAVAGVVHHRGRMVAVVDLRGLLGTRADSATLGNHLIVVEFRQTRVGLCADLVLGTIQVGADQVAPPAEGPRENRHRLIRGLAPGMVGILDLEALLGDPRLIINEVGGRLTPSAAAAAHPVAERGG